MIESAIGVFDSGLGGLTCVKQLLNLIPNENIIYFGDTARVPYGNRSKETIERYAIQAINFLLENNVKLLINACGSMSSSLDKEYTNNLAVPYLDCILPAVDTAVKVTKNNRIGVIATAATIRSQSFTNAILSMNKDITVIGKPCPLFVPLVEYGYISSDNRITREVAKDYLLPLKEENIDTLILGCTHYPIIKEHISAVLGEDISLIDSGAEAARQAARLYKGNIDGKGNLKVYVSDNPIGFLDIASTFLGFIPENIEQIDIELIEKG